MASDRFSSGLVEIESQWTLLDVENANLTLDLIEDAEVLNMPPPPKTR